MNLNKKTMTKLLNPTFRQKILQSMNEAKKQKLGIRDYAKYVVDSQILQKVNGHDDRKSGWGFPQLNIICAVKKDGSVEKKLFEFNTINHFLKDKDGDTAVEAVECILLLWAKNDKTVDCFDYEKIDAELVKLDQEASKIKAKEDKINATGKKIKELIEPTISKLEDVEYGEACRQVQEVVTKTMEKMKADKEVSMYALTFTRNTKETIAQKQLFVDISFKVEPSDDWVVLVCHKNGNKRDSSSLSSEANS